MMTRAIAAYPNVLYLVLLLALGCLLFWDVGNPAPWMDEGATILEGLSISSETYFFPTSDAARHPRATDRVLAGSVRLQSSSPIGEAYLAAIALRLIDTIGFVRLVFSLAGYIGMIIFSEAIRRVFPRYNMHIFFLCMLLASPHLFPFVRTIRHYPLQILGLSIFFWGLATAFRTSSQTALMSVGAGILLTYLVYWPLFFSLVVGVGSVLVWKQWSLDKALWAHGKRWVLSSVVISMSLVYLFNNHLQVLQGIMLGHGQQTDAAISVGTLNWASVKGRLLDRVAYVLNSHVRLTGVFDVALGTALMIPLLPWREEGKKIVRTLRRGLLEYSPVLLPAYVTWVSSVFLFALSEQLTHIRYSVGLHVFLIATCVVTVGACLRALGSNLQVGMYWSAIFTVFLVINVAYYFLDEPRKSKINQYHGYLEFLASDYRGPMDYYCDYLEQASGGRYGATVATNLEVDAIAACLRDPSLDENPSTQPEFVIPRSSPYPDLDNVASQIQQAETRYRAEYRLDDDYFRVNFPVIDFGFNSNLIGVPGADKLADCSANPASCARLYVRRDIYDQLFLDW